MAKPFKKATLTPEGTAFKTEFTGREDEPSNRYVRLTQRDNHMAWSSPVWFDD